MICKNGQLATQLVLASLSVSQYSKPSSETVQNSWFANLRIYLYPLTLLAPYTITKLRQDIP